MEEQRISLKAFTLIEIIMVIVILGILTALAAPRFEDFYSVKIRNAAKKIASDIRYVQQYAVANHTDYKITFSVAGNQYDCQKVSDSSYIKDPFTNNDFIVDFDTEPLFKPVKISNVSVNLVGGVLCFNWQGVPQSPSGTNLSSAGTVQLTYQGRTVTISVEPQTGLVTIQ